MIHFTILFFLNILTANVSIERFPQIAVDRKYDEALNESFLSEKE